MCFNYDRLQVDNAEENNNNNSATTLCRLSRLYTTLSQRNVLVLMHIFKVDMGEKHTEVKQML